MLSRLVVLGTLALPAAAGAKPLAPVDESQREATLLERGTTLVFKGTF